ncbi:MAG: hypothetical protein H0W15_11225 [Gemmatimonadales bacterium]|nr:hypothetical protein [Gemmatimonadales bacterium]
MEGEQETPQAIDQRWTEACAAVDEVREKLEELERAGGRPFALKPKQPEPAR